MKKVNVNGENMEVLEMDVKRKEEVKKELDYCKSTLENEFDHLYTYQEGFFYWVNTKKRYCWFYEK